MLTLTYDLSKPMLYHLRYTWCCGHDPASDTGFFALRQTDQFPLLLVGTQIPKITSRKSIVRTKTETKRNYATTE